MTVDSLHPLQLPRINEIREGKKFWGYLDTVALQTRYVLAAHFLRNTRNIIEIGGYRNNLITRFLTGTHDSVSIFSLDAEFEPSEQDTLNGAPCRVRHIHDYFQSSLLETKRLCTRTARPACRAVVSYSARKAEIGSTEAARRAGRKLASNAEPPNTTATEMSVVTSHGGVPKSSLRINEAATIAHPLPIRIPANANAPASLRMSR